MFISVFISYVCEIVVPGCNYRHNNKHEREADMMNTVSYRIASSHSYAKAETEWKDQDLSVPVPWAKKLLRLLAVLAFDSICSVMKFKLACVWSLSPAFAYVRFFLPVQTCKGAQKWFLFKKKIPSICSNKLLNIVDGVKPLKYVLPKFLGVFFILPIIKSFAAGKQVVCSLTLIIEEVAETKTRRLLTSEHWSQSVTRHQMH